MERWYAFRCFAIACPRCSSRLGGNNLNANHGTKSAPGEKPRRINQECYKEVLITCTTLRLNSADHANYAIKEACL